MPQNEVLTQKELTGRQYWLFVTRPRTYLDGNGQDREDLDPTDGPVDVSWTCHQQTRRGDLALLWRTHPHSDIGYLLEAMSAPYELESLGTVCDCLIHVKFKEPITIADLKGDERLSEWPALRSNFQGSTFPIKFPFWQALTARIAAKNPDDADNMHIAWSALESQIEDALATNLGRFRRFGYDLALYRDPSSDTTGRQFFCAGMGGRIDLLCYDNTARRFVVIELKTSRADRNTFGQVSSYVGWVEEKVADGKPVIGVVASRGVDKKFRHAMRVSDRIKQIDLKELGF